MKTPTAALAFVAIVLAAPGASAAGPAGGRAQCDRYLESEAARLERRQDEINESWETRARAAVDAYANRLGRAQLALLRDALEKTVLALNADLARLSSVPGMFRGMVHLPRYDFARVCANRAAISSLGDTAMASYEAVLVHALGVVDETAAPLLR